MVVKSKILAKSAVLRTAYFFTNVFIAFLMMPFIIHSLGDRMYGLWVVVGSVLGYYWLVDFGISTAVERGISRAVGRKEHDEINIVVNTGLFLYSLGGLVILALSAVTAYVLPYLIKNISDIIVFRKVLIIMGLSFAFNFPMRVFSGILRSFLRYDLMALVSFGILAVRTLLILYFLKSGSGIIALAGITLFTDIILRAALYVLARKVYADLRFSRSLIQVPKVKGLVKYGSFVFISQIANQMRFNIDNLVIVIFLGLSPVTLYSIASRLIGYFRKFMMNALGMMMPVFSQYEGQENYDAIREKFMFFTKINGYVSVLIGSIMIIFGKHFIQRWMGPEYGFAYNILLVLTLAVVFSLMQRSTFEVLWGISKHKYVAIVDICEAFANVILSIILVKRIGLIGVAYGTAIPLLIKQAFFLPPYVCSVLGISLKKYFMEGIVGVALRCVVMIGAPYLCYKNFIQPNYPSIFLLVCLQGLIFTGLTYIFGFNSAENKMVRDLLKGIKITIPWRKVSLG